MQEDDMVSHSTGGQPHADITRDITGHNGGWSADNDDDACGVWWERPKPSAREPKPHVADCAPQVHSHAGKRDDRHRGRLGGFSTVARGP